MEDHILKNYVAHTLETPTAEPLALSYPMYTEFENGTIKLIENYQIGLLGHFLYNLGRNKLENG